MSRTIIELRDQMHMNKKNWKQLFIGKFGDMVGGGIVSETVSKQIINLVGKVYDQIIR